MLVALLSTDAQGWVIIIGAIVLALERLGSWYVAMQRENAKLERDRIAAEKAEALKAEIKVSADEQTEKMNDVAGKVALSIKQTDGMKDELVAEIRKGSYLEGKQAQIDKTEALKAVNGSHEGEADKIGAIKKDTTVRPEAMS